MNKRILVVTRNLPPLIGGMERLNWHIADELSKDHDVSIISHTEAKTTEREQRACAEWNEASRLWRQPTRKTLISSSSARGTRGPIPVDMMLAPMALAKPHKAWHYAGLATSSLCWGRWFGYAHRCLEIKFTYPSIEKLKSTLSLSHKSDIIDSSLYDILGWRVKEEGAMVDLFNSLPQALKTEFFKYKKR